MTLHVDDWADFDSLKIRHVIAVDGEGISDADGTHRYTLLGASPNRAIEGHDLSTVDCFEFLLSLPREALKVGFSINYDVNMWLRDIPADHLKELLETEALYWKTYKIKYIPNKQTIISDQHGRRAHIYDVFGFFQCSFVKALEDWKICDRETVDAIAAMKEKRGTFTDAERKAVKRYCLSECNLLVDLMQRLIAATKRADIPCRNWYGVGALASGLLQKHEVKKYVGPAPLYLHDQVLAGYYGGRFEIAMSGDVGPVHVYDIKSAYPSVARYLPCLAHVRYQNVRQYDSKKMALWHVMWDVNEQSRWAPFPWRDDHYGIHYPTNGEGWYWDGEVEAAMRLHPKGVRVVEGVQIVRQCDHRPFAFIDDVYAERQRLEAEGDYANKTLKLALNSLYGKTAQSIGHGCKKHTLEKVKDCYACMTAKRPPYQSYIWAGRITSGTRAQILNTIRQAPSEIVSIATDSVVSRIPLELQIGRGLGEWDHTHWESCFLLQPGIYQLKNPCPHDYKEERCPHVIVRTRGFGKLETSFDAIIRDFLENPFGEHRYSATRFVGLASAMARTEYTVYWRKWVTADRVINFYPQSRFVDLAKIQRGATTIVHDPPRFKQIYKSKPYTPKMTWMDSWSLDPDMTMDMDQP